MAKPKLELKITGMTCASCEVLIERKWRRVPGVQKVHVDHASGKATIRYSQKPSLEALQQAIDSKYKVSYAHEQNDAVNKRTDYVELAIIFLIITAAYLILRRFDILPSGGITDNMTYGTAFVMGLIAAMSTCLAVTGGLLLAVSAKYAERHPEQSGAMKFKPHIHFNMGRVIGYTVLGGAVGALGSVLTLSPVITGILTLFVSVIMVLLGLQLLNLFPVLQRFKPKMPKFLAHRIYDAHGHEHPAAPFLLGAMTFFLPCGFTMALQLYVLSKGSMIVGALTMFAFSIGTVPALLSLGAVSSFAKGGFRHYFLRSAGVIVVILGVISVNSGLSLVTDGGFVSIPPKQIDPGVNPDMPPIDGKQVVTMKVVGYEYVPSQFTVKKGVPVEWRIDGTQATGCAQVLLARSINVAVTLPKSGIKTVTFTPNQVGRIPFSCAMGMTTPGAAFNVIE